MNFKAQLSKEAVNLGFLDLRVAKVELLENEFEHYKQWLSLGYNADMQWMERNLDKRRDISLILENAKSVIVTAHSYYTGIDYPEDLQGRGKISRYAWGDDYHDVVLKKLKLLEFYIKQYHPESESKSYVDTGAILERQWALKAGIGWQGKNGMIINQHYGSYFFIGIIISTLELEEDSQHKNLCGKCTKCLDACPTKAIVQPKVVDSNKCLSYWTIESKADSFPDEIRMNQNNWVFGCDICQEVCPWNRFAIKTQDSEFYPRNAETTLEKVQIEKMTDEEFSVRFKNSPVKRAKLKGLKRNFG
jgi:epoxyqueuosine reductase